MAGENGGRSVAVIPCLNEELAIGSIVVRARSHVDAVVVVDDGSTDRTADVARLAGATVLRNRRNIGKGAAVRMGFNFAQANGFARLVLLDGDGQHDPDEIPQVLAPLSADPPADAVWGIRDPKASAMPGYRRAGKAVLDYATAITTGTPVTDSQCGFRAFGRNAIQVMAARLGSDGFEVETEMIRVAQEARLRSAEVPVRLRYAGLDGSTQSPVGHGYRVMERIFVWLTMRRPLLTVGVPGLAFAVLGAWFGLRMLHVYNQTRVFVVSYALGAATLVLLGGIMIATSLMLNVILLLRRERA